MTEQQRRSERQPALALVAEELCVCDMTDGFCTPRNKDMCKCWDRASTLLHESGFSAQALVWILKHRTRIEQQAANHSGVSGIDGEGV